MSAYHPEASNLPTLGLVNPFSDETSKSTTVESTAGVSGVVKGENVPGSSLGLEDRLQTGSDASQGKIETFKSSDSDLFDEADSAFTAFGLSCCPECGKKTCFRPVQEWCGHFKCRKCYIESEEDCVQCLESVHDDNAMMNKDPSCGKNELMSNDGQGSNEEERPGIFIRPNKELLEEEEEGEEQDDEIDETSSCGRKKIILKEGQSLVEFELNGKKTYAVLSEETLHKLKMMNQSQSEVSDEKESQTQSGDGDGSDGDTQFKDHSVKSETMDEQAGGDQDDDDDPTKDEDYIPPRALRSRPAKVSRPNPSILKKGMTRKKRSERKSLKKLSSSHIVECEDSESDQDQVRYHCTSCNEKFSERYKYNYHLFCDPANGSRPYTCKFCNKEFTSSSHYDYHIRLHTGERPFPCTLCPKSFIQKVKLNRHMRVHARKSSSSKQSQLRLAAARPRSQVETFKPYLCAICRRRFLTLSSVKRHVANHSEETPFECSTCHKKFKQKSALDMHAKIHDSSKRCHKCSECEKAFTTPKDLRRHFLIHTGEHPFECSICQAKFKRKDNLERHIRMTHKLEESLIKLMSGQQAEKYYKSRNPDVMEEEDALIDGILKSVGK